jgi:hypothetical protein
MTQLDEALARFDKLIHSPSYQDLSWANSLQDRMAAIQLAPAGRPVCPVLRPHLITKRQYDAMEKTAQILHKALERVQQWAISSPQLLNKLELFPAEKMLAQIDPGYPQMTPASYLELLMRDSSIWVTRHSGEGPTNALYCDPLTDVFYDSRPIKELRKKYKLSKHANGTKKLVQALLGAYKHFPNKKKFPRIGIVEFGQGLKSGPGGDSILLAEYLRKSGYPTEVVMPEHLEYRNGLLSRGDFGLDIVYRRISAQELLVRFDLNHPLVRAYRDRAICMVNGFRAELVSKLSIFSLITSDEIQAKLPAVERKAVREHVPWTRMVANVKTTRDKKTVDLPEFITHNKDKLILRPNEATADLQTYFGWETEQSTWERAVKAAMMTPYVVQERAEEARSVFPVLQFGRLEMREMRITAQPYLFGGKMDGVGAEVADATSSFSLLSGVAPVFVIEGSA